MHVVKILVTILVVAAVCLPGNRIFMEEIPSPENGFLMAETEPATDPEGGYDPTGGASSNS